MLRVKDFITELQKESPEALIDFQFIGYKRAPGEVWPKYIPVVYQTCGIEKMMISKTMISPHGSIPPYTVMIRIIDPAHVSVTNRMIEHKEDSE